MYASKVDELHARDERLFKESVCRQLALLEDELALRIVAVFLRDADVDVRKLAEHGPGAALGLAGDVAEGELLAGIHLIDRNAGLSRNFLGIDLANLVDVVGDGRIDFLVGQSALALVPGLEAPAGEIARAVLLIVDDDVLFVDLEEHVLDDVFPAL